MRMHEKSRGTFSEEGGGDFIFRAGFDLFTVSFDAERHTFARKRITAPAPRDNENVAKDLPSSSPPSLSLFPIRDRVTWFWNLSKEPGFVIFRAKIGAKSVCKVPPDFPRDSRCVFGLRVTI